MTPAPPAPLEDPPAEFARRCRTVGQAVLDVAKDNGWLDADAHRQRAATLASPVAGPVAYPRPPAVLPAAAEACLGLGLGADEIRANAMMLWLRTVTAVVVARLHLAAQSMAVLADRERGTLVQVAGLDGQARQVTLGVLACEWCAGARWLGDRGKMMAVEALALRHRVEDMATVGDGAGTKLRQDLAQRLGLALVAGNAVPGIALGLVTWLLDCVRLARAVIAGTRACGWGRKGIEEFEPLLTQVGDEIGPRLLNEMAPVAHVGAPSQWDCIDQMRQVASGGLTWVTALGDSDGERLPPVLDQAGIDAIPPQALAGMQAWLDGELAVARRELAAGNPPPPAA